MEIDGSRGEGGGQMLRMAVALSALTKRSVKIENIRAKRSNPGLAAQHLTAVRGVAKLCSAIVKGDSVGSTTLEFEPGRVKGGSFHLDVGTAGSVTLVLESCMLASLQADGPVSLRVLGGTNVHWSPPVDYFSHVLLPLLLRMGVHAELRLGQRGFYPQGGGEVDLALNPPKRILALDEVERGHLIDVNGVCFSRNLPDHVCSRMSAAVRKRFLNTPPSITSDVGQGRSSGAGVQLWATFERTILGADALGERGLPAEKVGENAADALFAEIESG
ncbi:MAG TPA: RNA 3'-terminal phosphate cyclase, partial [Methanomassiliicoccales archaeon]|nr:RNA 3'-terminal phosphate cyclase [Methanomassiliicoccales archaeon]